jgi:hypothetical protein
MLNQITRLFSSQKNKKSAAIQLTAEQQESIKRQIQSMFQDSGRFNDIDLQVIDSEHFDRMSCTYGEWLLSIENLLSSQSELNKQEINIKELERERASIEALIHEGPDYPKYVTFFSLCLSLIPGSNLIWTGFKAIGLLGGILGATAGFAVYTLLEMFYKYLIHRDLIKFWDVNIGDKHQILRRQIIVYLGFCFFLLLDGIFTWAAIMFRLQSGSQSGYDPGTIGTLDYGILFASIVTDILLICFLYQTVSPNEWTRVKVYSRDEKDLSVPGEKRSKELQWLQMLRRETRRLENDIAEWGEIKTSRYNSFQNDINELFGETPARALAADSLESGLIEIIVPKNFSKRNPWSNTSDTDYSNSKNNHGNNQNSQDRNFSDRDRTDKKDRRDRTDSDKGFDP